MNASIRIVDGTAVIDSLSVDDAATVTYIEQLEGDARLSGVLNCLQIGARALRFAADKSGVTLLSDAFKAESEKTRSLLEQVSKTAERSVWQSSEAMEKAMGELLAGLSKDLRKTLDPANTESIIGKLRVTLSSDYQRITDKVCEDLDLTNPSSPLASFRTELENNEERRHETLRHQIEEVLRGMAAKDAARSERLKSSRKGGDFEVATLDYLAAESRPRKDLVTHTAAVFGLDQNQVGDFVIELNPSDAQSARIVVECKNRQKNSMKDTVRELRKAMNNRGAGFGIAVITGLADVTQAIAPFGDDMLIVRVPALPDEDGWDFTALGIALECARWKTVVAKGAAGSVDLARLNAEIDRALAIANNVSDVKRKLTSVRTSLDEIPKLLDDMKCQLVGALEGIREAVGRDQLTPEAA